MSDLTSIIQAGLNNPECSFFTGLWVGQIFIIKWLFGLFIGIMIFKAVDKLAYDPFLNWIKKRVYKK